VPSGSWSPTTSRCPAGLRGIIDLAPDLTGWWPRRPTAVEAVEANLAAAARRGRDGRPDAVMDGIDAPARITSDTTRGC